MADLSSPDSDDPLGIGRKLNLHHRPRGIFATSAATAAGRRFSLGTNGIRPCQVDPMVHKHVEENIETFLENFKHKTWCVDVNNKSGLLDRRASSDSGDSSTGWTSSVLSTADDVSNLSTDSPDKESTFDPSVDCQDRQGIIAESRRIARWAWRQSRFAENQKSPCACSYHPAHAAMDEVCKHYKVIDVAPLIQSNYAILTGGKAKNGAPVLTFPSRLNCPEVSDEDYKKVVTYLCGITSLHESESGFVVVIDRRQDGWGAVKSILVKLSTFYPVHIQVVFLLQPTGFFQRAFADLRSKFVKEELEFKVVLCDSPKDMEDYIETSQLTVDVGGELEFDSNEWTEHRSAVEKYSQNTNQLSKCLSAVVKKMEERELPNDVSGIEAMIKICEAERKEVIEDLDSTSTHGETLLKCIKGDNVNTPLTKRCHVVELERLLVQLEESRTGFGEFWQKQQVKLEQSLKAKKFEEDFKVSQFSMERRLEKLEARLSEFGESVGHNQTLFKEFESFEEESQKDIDQAVRMRSRGRGLMLDDPFVVDSIRLKCEELERMCEQFRDMLRQRRELLTKSHDLHDRMERASIWCNTGVGMLAGQNIDSLQTTTGAQEALREIDHFLSKSHELKLSNPCEFRQLFEPIMTTENKAIVQDSLKKIEDVQVMCEKRKESLKKVANPQQRSVQIEPTSAGQRLPREQSQTFSQSKSNSSEKLQQAKTTNQNKPSVISLEKSARYRPKILHETPLKSINRQISSSHSNMTEHSTPVSHVSSRSSDALAPSTQPNGHSDMTALLDSENFQAKKKHVMNELIESEEIYVSELNQILQGYYQKFEDRSLQMMIPPALLGQKNILFGNLSQIYNFHKNVFLEELKKCRDAPLIVGNCFVNRKEEFQMYSIYCQNKPKSEALRVLIGDNNPFFKECQHQLGHRLPLGAYLLKPVQRITKYQLLLKEMLKFTGESEELTAALREAQDTMLSVLLYLNDSMHQVAISGYSEDISDLGRLLMHGSFRVWTHHKNERIRDLRLRAMQRHLFLYQSGFLFCKKREDNHGNNDQPSYTFKNKLEMSHVGLTEKVKGDKKKFELWLRGREKVFIIQAPDLHTKDIWVKEIKMVLLTQFDHIKANRSKLPSVNEDTSQNRLSSCSSDYSFENCQPEDLESLSAPSVDMTVPSLHEDHDEDYDEDFDGGWSSGEFSDSDVESHEPYIPKIEPSYREHFVSLGDYFVVDPTELGLKEGDEVEVMRVGTNGWWYAHHLRTNQEGWVPSTFLEPISRVNSLYSSSDSLRVRGSQGEMDYSPESQHDRSPIPETTV